jgi:hypothetical protein
VRSMPCGTGAVRPARGCGGGWSVRRWGSDGRGAAAGFVALVVCTEPARPQRRKGRGRFASSGAQMFSVTGKRADGQGGRHGARAAALESRLFRQQARPRFVSSLASRGDEGGFGQTCQFCHVPRRDDGFVYVRGGCGDHDTCYGAARSAKRMTFLFSA